jgi:hypothetical protein
MNSPIGSPLFLFRCRAGLHLDGFVGYDMAMKRFVPLFCLFVLGSLLVCDARAQEATTGEEEALPVTAPPSQELLLAELDKRRPDDSSPFFVLREEAAFYNTEAGQEAADSRRVAIYPNTAGQDSVSYLFKQFALGLAKSFRFGKEKPAKMTGIEVVPDTSFNLEERREISASLSVTNQGNRLLALEFPTEQRYEFVIRDSAGAVIERWSDDRTFGQEQGVIMVNPGERIEYTATLSTREMKEGQEYVLEGSIAAHPDFTHQVTLTPY